MRRRRPMAPDDYAVVVYKVLSYLYECIKKDVVPNVDKAREVSRVGDAYFGSVAAYLVSRGYVLGECLRDMNGGVMSVESLSITLEGVEYLEENSRMRKARAFLGKAFEGALSAAVAATAML